MDIRRLRVLAGAGGESRTLSTFCPCGSENRQASGRRSGDGARRAPARRHHAGSAERSGPERPRDPGADPRRLAAPSSQGRVRGGKLDAQPTRPFPGCCLCCRRPGGAEPPERGLSLGPVAEERPADRRDGRDVGRPQGQEAGDRAPFAAGRRGGHHARTASGHHAGPHARGPRRGRHGSRTRARVRRGRLSAPGPARPATEAGPPGRRAAGPSTRRAHARKHPYSQRVRGAHDRTLPSPCPSPAPRQRDGRRLPSRLRLACSIA